MSTQKSFSPRIVSSILESLSYSAPRNVEMKKKYVLNPFAPEFIPRAKRYNETFLKIFNDSLKQFLTAAASPSNAAFASQFPNVLGGNGLVLHAPSIWEQDYEHPPYQK